MPSNLLRKIYYEAKPLIPRRTQVALRRILIKRQLEKVKSYWPICEAAKLPPPNWQGWPGEKKFALVLTHDVEQSGGQDKCLAVMKMEQALGFRSSFNFVPERYEVSAALRQELIDEGFEVGVHGLNHDGKLFSSKEIFLERAVKINQYLAKWGSVGFRAPAMHHNLEWIHSLDIEYDTSTFDVDPFEPQADDLKTIFPIWVPDLKPDSGYVELPYTLPQDFTLLVLMRDGIGRWQKKLDWIAECGGMALVNVHPDYMNFDRTRNQFDQFPAQLYNQFISYVRDQYAGKFWNPLPREMARFWRENYAV